MINQMVSKNYLKPLFGLIFIFSVNNISAQLTKHAGVKYKTEYYYSEYYFREIELYTGRQLNDATNSSNYTSTADYALIWFDEDKVAIIRLDQKIKNDNFDRNIGNGINQSEFDFFIQMKGYHHYGKDQDNTEWKICFRSDEFEWMCN